MQQQLQATADVTAIHIINLQRETFYAYIFKRKESQRWSLKEI